MIAEVWTRYPTNEAPSEDEILFGVRVADAWNGDTMNHHIDQYCSLRRRWEADEQIPRYAR